MDNFNPHSNIGNVTFVRKFVELIFYGNYFYGLCSVSNMIETTVELAIPFNTVFLYASVFIATVVFYNYPYARNYSGSSSNPRTQWYINNHSQVIKTQVVLTLLLLSAVAILFIKYHRAIEAMNILQWSLLLVFPVAGAMYYGANFISAKYNLRSAGRLKPFVIGFVWAGVVIVYPIVFETIFHNKAYKPSPFALLLFLKTLMFISLLAIMFDIKDYATDSNSKLGTFVVRIGIQKTIFYVLVPLTLLGIFTFLSYALLHHFSTVKMILILIPFLLLIVAAISLKKPRPLLFYLIIIDGLMIVKAVFGVLAFSI